MARRDDYLAELREKTNAHLSALAGESGEAFADYAGLGQTGTAIYSRLVDQFNMDGAQEISAELVALFTGDMDEGTITITDRAFRGMSMVLEEFGADLPETRRRQLHELIRSLARADKRDT